uniref:K Homology domain-containing protein n=1 Tax=Romanomermis culicivorax TaxID=13658 RepID=A0A915K429_ROMCU
MSTVQGNYAKIAIIGSTVAYLSAGMALYYIYKRYRDRQRSKNRRKLSKTLSSASLHIKKEREGCDCKHCTGVEKILSCDLMQSCRRENDDQNDALECNVTQKVARNLQHENTENIKADPAAPEIITNATTFVSLKIDNSTGNVQNNNGKSHLSGIDCVDSQVCDVEVSSTMRQQDQHILGDDFSHNMIHSKNECVNSPSISSDGECSQDSGKGASMGLTTSTSPVNDLVGIELPPMYEFEVPQDIVGLIIGRKGATIKYFTEESGAHILNLPEGVSCEVTLSSMVDASHFFVQQPTHPTFPSLARLDQYLLAVYSQPAGVPGLPKPIEKSEGWSAEANAFFEKCVHGKLSEAVLLAKEKDSLIPMVELYCSVDGKMEKISQLLVDNGYAALVDCSTESYADSLATCNF